MCVNLQLLATVLSQSAKAKEHLMEQSKSVDQPPGRTGARTEGELSSTRVLYFPPLGLPEVRFFMHIFCMPKQ